MTAPVMQVARVPATSAFMPSANDLVPPLRRKAPEAADQDAEAAEVGKTAQGIGHDQPAARIKGLGRELGHFEKGQQLVQDRLGAHEVSAVCACGQGMPKSQTTGAITKPSILWRVSGLFPTSGRRPMSWFAR